MCLTLHCRDCEIHTNKKTYSSVTTPSQFRLTLDLFKHMQSRETNIRNATGLSLAMSKLICALFLTFPEILISSY